jgi:glycosyltransferase involved in cell wall biosynthesis
MKIAVNARMLSQRRPGGIAEFSYQTLRRLTRDHAEHDFLFIVDRPFPGRRDFPANVSEVRTIPSFHPLLWYPWFEVAVPAILRGHKPDLFLSTDGFTTLSSKVPAALVVHDLCFHHHPEDLPLPHRAYMNRFFPRFVRKARVLATVSEYSKQDLVRTYGLSPDKITVVHGAADERFRPLSSTEKDAATRELTGGAPYFLYVGMMHPRKNLVRLLQAYDRFRRSRAGVVKLVLAGPGLFKTGEMYRTWRQMAFQDDVVFLGVVPRERLVRVYGAAAAFLYVSSFEGFGLPVLEAMACGVPVIASDGTSLPEVCGDAALMVDPGSVESISRAMGTLSSDPGLGRALVERGLERRTRFTWDETARRLWGAIEKVLR